MAMLKERQATKLSEEALRQVGHVASLQVCVKHRAPMLPLKTVTALENFGLEGDRHSMPDSSRQVLLLEQETLLDYNIPAGAIRENITTREIDLMSLPRGTRLQVGAAILETTKECAPCSMVDEVRQGLQEELQGKRGMLARIVQGGEIRLGDSIRILV